MQTYTRTHTHLFELDPLLLALDLDERLLLFLCDVLPATASISKQVPTPLPIYCQSQCVCVCVCVCV